MCCSKAANSVVRFCKIGYLVDPEDIESGYFLAATLFVHVFYETGYLYGRDLRSDIGYFLGKGSCS